MSGEIQKFTEQQQAAIDYNGTLLVSAAAGSGKTRVLVERLLKRVTESGIDIDRFLVITFSNAAAAELRSRIMEEISKRLAADPSDRQLRRQSILASNAPISTIHKLCIKILREYPHLTDLKPDFRVAEENECAIIKAEVLEAVLDREYETIEENDGLKELVRVMSTGRDDKNLRDIIIDTHASLQSNPNPERWGDMQSARFEFTGVTDASETIWGAYLIEKTRKTALFWLDEMRGAREKLRISDKADRAYGGVLDETADGLAAFIDALGRGWDAACACRDIPFNRPKPLSGFDDMKGLRNRCKTAVKKFSALFSTESQGLLEDMTAIAPAVKELLRIIAVFSAAYGAEKRRRSIVDFSDLEHYALKLLIDPETGDKTRAAREISKNFAEVMVDEYQDVNAVQELIFNALSQDGGNIFMVGDVKQSIYRFRLADPTIFLKKLNSYKNAGAESGGSGGARIMLSKNFRSCAGVLDAVNSIFRKIMSTDFGEMEYTDDVCLIPGRTDAEHSNTPAVEFDIIEHSGAEEDDEEKTKNAEAEAEYAAERIKQLIGSYMIPDEKGGMRPAEPSDIVILLRSANKKAHIYSKSLAARGIASETPDSGDFFKEIEISAVISLLEVIDNPMQDIPLAAVMSSPVFGFTPDELALIRTEFPDGSFYSAVEHSSASDEKCASFLKKLDALRVIAPDMSAGRFIWHVYNTTGILAYYGAMNGGARRRANLYTLLGFASRFDSGEYRGLFGFLSYIRALRENGKIFAPERPATEPDAVRIMSIHKSKGLEFPIVFLADTSKLLNNKDAQKPLVIHTDLGVGAAYTDRHRRVSYPTLPRLAIQSKLTSETAAEEMRLLYVAMTRAREKLIITAVYKNAVKALEKFSMNLSDKVPPVILAGENSVAAWILLAALTDPAAESLRCAPYSAEADCCGMRLRIVTPPPHNEPEFCDTPDQPARDSEVPPETTAARDSSIPPETAAAEAVKLRRRFEYIYPHESAVHLPSKLTVTELKGRLTDYEAAEEADELYKSPSGRNRFIFERPDFIKTDTAPTGAEKGTALHITLQYIDFNRCSGVESVRGEIERLFSKKLITRRQAEIVEPLKIVEFFDTELGRKIMSSDSCKREFKFSLLYPSSEFYADGGADEIMLQGVIDCFFEENGELTVVDFKTDHVTEDSVGQKLKEYTPQLYAYSDALERILKKRVKSRVIYFFELGKAYEI